MTLDTEKLKLHKMAALAMAEVMTTQLNINVEEINDLKDLENSHPCVKAHVIMQGVKFKGEVLLQIPEDYVRQVAQRIFGFNTTTEVSTNDLKDVVGELSNMIAGRVAAELAVEGLTCTLIPPVSYIGPRQKIINNSGAHLSQTYWLCDHHLITLEVKKEILL